jgi:hypothetical protein
VIALTGHALAGPLQGSVSTPGATLFITKHACRSGCSTRFAPSLPPPGRDRGTPHHEPRRQADQPHRIPAADARPTRQATAVEVARHPRGNSRVASAGRGHPHPGRARRRHRTSAASTSTASSTPTRRCGSGRSASARRPARSTRYSTRTSPPSSPTRPWRCWTPPARTCWPTSG